LFSNVHKLILESIYQLYKYVIRISKCSHTQLHESNEIILNAFGTYEHTRTTNQIMNID